MQHSAQCQKGGARHQLVPHRQPPPHSQSFESFGKGASDDTLRSYTVTQARVAGATMYMQFFGFSSHCNRPLYTDKPFIGRSYRRHGDELTRTNWTDRATIDAFLCAALTPRTFGDSDRGRLSQTSAPSWCVSAPLPAEPPR
eukprot:TRINITY_DN18780_c0_g3_i1.p2 TRINITY_DN18780_c0_g3~~TRINITY_DN18780_c0_g3_i1.p2  ORF type:complete len:142 (+),score=0.02 TRINITY_DN18780_c0_g3_i1:184-609(+)